MTTKKREISPDIQENILLSDEQLEMITIIGAEKLLLKGFTNYKSLVVDAIYRGLETELATAFYTNIFDFNYFYENKLYGFLNIDYSKVLSKFKILDSTITKLNVDDYCLKILDILVEIKVDDLKKTLFLAELISLHEKYSSGSWKLNDILDDYPIKYNKLLLYLYIDRSEKTKRYFKYLV